MGTKEGGDSVETFCPSFEENKKWMDEAFDMVVNIKTKVSVYLFVHLSNAVAPERTEFFLNISP